LPYFRRLLGNTVQRVADMDQKQAFGKMHEGEFLDALKTFERAKLTPHQKREAIKRRDIDGEISRSIGRSYNVSAQTIGRLES
jgi:CENP-B N-terminal DNA-binding domain